MTVSELILPGEKVDIIAREETEKAGKRKLIEKRYHSQVLDVLPNGNFELSMPMERGKLVSLSLGLRYTFVFYSGGNLYQAAGQIKERYKSENIYTLEIELKTEPERFQRREYYRYACIMDFSFYMLTQEEVDSGTAEAIFVRLQRKKEDAFSREEKEAIKRREKKGQIVDLSGGGMKFRTEKEVEVGRDLLAVIYLKNEHVDKQYYIICNTVSCVRHEEWHNAETKYEVRVEFVFDDDKIREEIIRYIFEEERKTRQREKR
ncbi:MAG: flagellar brake protein [Roseburia sp.]